MNRLIVIIRVFRVSGHRTVRHEKLDVVLWTITFEWGTGGYSPDEYLYSDRHEFYFILEAV